MDPSSRSASFSDFPRDATGRLRHPYLPRSRRDIARVDEIGGYSRNARVLAKHDLFYRSLRAAGIIPGRSADSYLPCPYPFARTRARHGGVDRGFVDEGSTGIGLATAVTAASRIKTTSCIFACQKYILQKLLVTLYNLHQFFAKFYFIDEKYLIKFTLPVFQNLYWGKYPKISWFLDNRILIRCCISRRKRFIQRIEVV